MNSSLPIHRRWLRFSLRSMFALVTLVAVLTYWFSQPTFLTREFQRAFDQRDYARVQQILADGDQDLTFEDILLHMPASHPTVSVTPLTLQDFLSGRRQMIVYLDWAGVHLWMDVTRHGAAITGSGVMWNGPAPPTEGGPRSMRESKFRWQSFTEPVAGSVHDASVSDRHRS